MCESDLKNKPYNLVRNDQFHLRFSYLYKSDISFHCEECFRIYLLYERFTNPTPPSFVTMFSTIKLGLGLPNKVMSTCVLSKLELDESKKFGEREFSFEFFFIEFRESL